ncbi:uncharacterized protein [Symphalangus syndactylus]|uniref:uncharacterized protein isoform X6 n=1 Tax=Symphalangus syndactylus TaxID=9590 RepID=UPI002443113B|nr:uncharacterized protein LOC129472916 isoform X5 [Symphalangus syndactylus]
MPDNRVQCCLSFIVPSGHGLTPLDIEFMKCLHEKVNIIPLIAKADTLTPEECQQFKKQSLQYCLGTSGNSKPRPHMKKTGKGFVTMENTCRAKASASAEGNDTAGGRRRKRRTSFTRSLDHVSMPTLYFMPTKEKKMLLNTQKAEKRPLSLHLQKPSKRVGLRMHPFFYSLSNAVTATIYQVVTNHL